MWATPCWSFSSARRLVGTTACSPIVCAGDALRQRPRAQNLELDIIEPMLTDAEAAVLRRG